MIKEKHYLGSASAVLAAMLALSPLSASAADTIRVRINEYSPATADHYKDLAEQFNATQDDWEVVIEPIVWDNSLQKYTTEAAANRLPDIGHIGTRWMIDFVANDMLLPIDELLTDDFAGTFVDTFLGLQKFEGQTWGLPIAASTRAMYYNSDLFEQAGVAPPTTWDEALAAAKAISDLGDDIFGFGIQGAKIETEAYFFYSLWSHGGQIFDGGKSAIASDAAVNALNVYRQFIDEGLAQPGVGGNDRQDIEKLFKAGRLGFLLSGPWLVKQLAEEAPDVNYGITAIPVGTDRTTYGVTDTIVVFNSTEHPDGAWAFLEFMFSHDARMAFGRNEGFIPVLKSVSDDPLFANDEGLKPFVDQAPFANFAPLVPRWEEMADVIARAVQQVYVGDATAADVLPAAASDIDALMQ